MKKRKKKKENMNVYVRSDVALKILDPFDLLCPKLDHFTEAIDEGIREKARKKNKKHKKGKKMQYDCFSFLIEQKNLMHTRIS
jgi:hypothetical protein